MLGGVSQANFKNLTYSRAISPKVPTFSVPYLGRRGTPKSSGRVRLKINTTANQT